MKQTYIIPLVTPEVKLVIAARKYFRLYRHYPESISLASSEVAKCAWAELRMPENPKAQMHTGTPVIIAIKPDDTLQPQEVVCFERFAAPKPPPEIEVSPEEVPGAAPIAETEILPPKRGGQKLVPFDQTGAKRVGEYRGGKKQIHVLTDPGRAMMLAEYDGTKSVIDDLAERLRVPRWTVKKWGSQLGLARKKEPIWTDQDVRYLEGHLHRQSLGDIAAHLGRTKVAVRLKAKRVGVNKTQEGYTMRGLCMGLGCDHHKVEKWMKHGWLHGQRRGSERPVNDIWLFTDNHIRDFIVAHPLEIDARRMDWLWVVDLLAHGAVAGSLIPLEGEEEPMQELKDGEMNLDTKHLLHLDIDTMASTSMALLGISRSGKTNTAFVIIEELLANNTAMTIVDIEGEYWTLAKSYDILVCGRSEHCRLDISVENAADIAHDSMESGTAIILDLSEYATEECQEILCEYMTALWVASGKVKRPYQIVLEEAHEWIPQIGTTLVKDVLIRIALRGRKRGLALMVISQRSAKVNKDILSQIDLLFLHHVVHPVDMNVYKMLIPLQPTVVERTIGALQKGQAVVVHDHVPQVIQIRLQGNAVVQLDQKTILRKRIKELEDQIFEKDEIIQDQANTIARMCEAHPDLMMQQPEPMCVM